MKILLVNIDSKIPNIALHKIALYHFNKDDSVEWHNDGDSVDPLKYDKIYVSCLFTWNNSKASIWSSYDTAISGGTGISLSKKLPPDINCLKPKINVGFTTRGCNRNCDFCVVHAKEGNIKAVADVYDIWDGQSKDIMFLDNNILQLPNHFKKICSQLRNENLKVDFNQGLDIRLVDDSIIKEINTIKFKKLRFAWDFIKTEKVFTTNLKKVLKSIKPSRVMVYMLVDYNTTFKEDMYRLQKIRRFGCDAFVMRYNKGGDLLIREFARWNNLFFFRNLSFENFLKKRNNTYLLDGIDY